MTREKREDWAWINSLRAENARLKALLDEAAEVLRDAERWFRQYAYGHEAKGAVDMAAVCHRRADACRALLARIGGTDAA